MPIWRNCPGADGMAPQKKRPGSAVARPLTSGAPDWVQHALRVGQQRAQVWAEAGRENDRIEALGWRVPEGDDLRGQSSRYRREA